MRTWIFLSIGCLTIILSTGCEDCQKDANSPAMLKDLPAGAQVLFQLDGRALTNTYGSMLNLVSKIVPQEGREEIPSWDQIVAKLRQPTGIDLNKVGLVLAASYFDTQSGSPKRVSVIAEGLSAKDLIGAQIAEHNNNPLFQLKEEKKLFYAQLDAKHVAAAESQDSLQIILDTHAGKNPGLRSPMLSRLQRIDPAFGHLRVYLLSGDFPGLEKSPVKVDGGGFFVDFEKGFSAAIIGDSEGLGKLKLMAEMGLMQAKNELSKPEALARAQAEGMGPAIAAGKSFIEGIKFQHDGDQLSVAYQGDQPPMMLMGIMAAVAIPAFVSYIRKSKLSEVHENLDRGYKGVVDYYDRPQALADGTYRQNQLPPGMPEPVCPGDRKLETLDSQARLFDPDRFGAAEVFKLTGFYPAGKSYACYQFVIDPADKASEGVTGFTWHAWTDLDDDDKPAHWTKKGIFHKETGSFLGGHVWHDEAGDDW